MPRNEPSPPGLHTKRPANASPERIAEIRARHVRLSTGVYYKVEFDEVTDLLARIDELEAQCER